MPDSRSGSAPERHPERSPDLTSQLQTQLQTLRLETFYDLLVALHDNRSESDLLEELVGRACAVLDPAAALALTRDEGGVRGLVTVGWEEPPGADLLLASSLWGELLVSRELVVHRGGTFCGRAFRELLAVPLAFRDEISGMVVMIDKESRGATGGTPTFGKDDERFLGSLAALGGVTLDGLRRVESLVDRSERLEEENKLLKERLVHEVGGQRVIAEAPPMRRTLEIAHRIAPRGVSVLLRGESGTGKELVARLLHEVSGRSGHFVAVNCAAVPESLLEAELFGIEGGVATGVQARIGKFQLADGGTLFLDEVGDMDLALQVKLLRVLQERELVRVGGLHPKKIDVRVVSATHQDLEHKVAGGAFREDLYYRLKGVEIELPPLRERREDIAHLVRYFAERFVRREKLQAPRFERQALSLLLGHEYAGNVRELQSVVEGAIALASDGVVDAALVESLLDSSARPRPAAESPFSEDLQHSPDLAALERSYIEHVLELTQGNKSAAARVLGIDRKTLTRKGF